MHDGRSLHGRHRDAPNGRVYDRRVVTTLVIRLLRPPEIDQSQPPQASEGAAGTIEIALPNGARVCVDASVNEKALLRVLRAMRSTL